MPVNDQLDQAIAGVFLGPPDDFVRRRDALVKELRAAGDRDGAATVKALRKPSRAAWALNVAAAENEEIIRRLEAGVSETIEAQASSGDVRAAVARMRESVREFADQAGRAAEKAGFSLEPAVLSAAVLAVLARPDSVVQLRRGVLAEIPEAGGLDFLSALPSPPPRAHAGAPPPEQKDTQTAARASLAEARERAEQAQRVFKEARANLWAAEDRLKEAEKAVEAARRRHDEAKRDAESAAAQVAEDEARLSS